MRAAAEICRFAGIVSVLPAMLCGAAPAQTGAALPATAATALEVPGRPVPPASEQAGGHRAEVSLHDGLMTVTATGSSLNAVLREVARQTGMKISGSVRDERVFGSYGPAAPSAILSTLLEGTGSNMLLVNNADDQPAQLILTPRLGGPTPPNRMGGSQDQGGDEDDAGPQLFRPPAAFGASPRPPAQPAPSRPNVQTGPDLNPPITSPTVNNSDTQPVVFPPVNATTTPATATTSSDTTQTAPGGVRTPQQIFEQLQRLRQQQEQTQQQAAPPQ